MSDKDTIYVVISGDYSDKCNVGYFKNKDEAEKYTLYKQGNTEESYYVDEVNMIETDSCFDDMEILTLYTFYYGWCSGSWKVSSHSYRDYLGNKKSPKVKTNHGNSMEVSVTCDNYEKAKKISEDELYMFIAKQKGIS